MVWKITAYNGTTWTAPYTMLPTEAIQMFLVETGLVNWDIKFIENLH